MRNAGHIESRRAEEIVLDGEAGGERICGIAGAERAEEAGSHAGVEILADLERDLDFLGERKGYIVGQKIFLCVAARDGFEVRLCGDERAFDLYAFLLEDLTEHGFGEKRGRGNGNGSSLWLDAHR